LTKIDIFDRKMPKNNINKICYKLRRRDVHKSFLPQAESKNLKILLRGVNMANKTKKVISVLLAVVMLFSVLTTNASAKISYDEAASGTNYYSIVSKKDWQLAPGIEESEIVLNNDAGSRRQVLHVVEVDIENEYTKVIPSYKGMIPQAGSYGTQTMDKQAAFAEANGYGNVVAAMNISLSWYNSAYYTSNPGLVGEPLGYMIVLRE
jgi:hypothetical protein